jgi:hypothetical protein
MKTTFLLLFSAILGLSSCNNKSQKTLADYYEDHPGKSEMTATRNVKGRTVRENRKRVQYYNSIQHR